MKKLFTLFTISIIAVLFSTAAFAHPPKSVSLSWDSKSEVLTVKAEHKVNSTTQHYVISVAVTQDGNQLAQKRYTSQTSADSFSDNIHLKGLKSGSKISVSLTCNIMGTAQTDYIIP
ncbi:MAG: hypothetical protein RR272_01110 [Synergistaceae bacterium]